MRHPRLDVPVKWKAYGEIMTTNEMDLAIGGMTCDHCVHHVTEGLMGLEGVVNASVDLAAKSAHVTLDGTVDSGTITVAERAVTGSHYWIRGKNESRSVGVAEQVLSLQQPAGVAGENQTLVATRFLRRDESYIDRFKVAVQEKPGMRYRRCPADSP